MAIEERITNVKMTGRLFNRNRPQNGGAEGALSGAPNGALEFSDVYRSHLGKVYAYVGYRINDRESVEDVTQTVFEKAFKAWAEYDPLRANISTWLTAIARNAVADFYRRSGNAKETSLEEKLEKAGVDWRSQRHEPGSGLSSELAVAIGKLDDREKEILSMKFGMCITNREIASVLGITESNTGTILYRSLKKLRERLEDWTIDE